MKRRAARFCISRIDRWKRSPWIAKSCICATVSFPKYSTLVYNGFWFSPEREALQALVTETQRDVTGLVRLKLYKGNIIVAGRKSPKSLYDPKIATMEGDASAYDQNDATGFIRLNALRLKLRGGKRSASKSKKGNDDLRVGRVSTWELSRGTLRGRLVDLIL